MKESILWVDPIEHRPVKRLVYFFAVPNGRFLPLAGVFVIAQMRISYSLL